ncbi:tetratricopeptide repeat protein [Prochlorococcus marinus]|uniref:tetratricopeptide repeat protein n=1 Tax=Prochlorococcus marinus TaxID=1219 RepID=UPI0022B5D871|nr:tetratricopeptide repeat protein [Prochlorococcus marinus]
MKGFGKQSKSKKKEISNKNSNPSKEKIINQALKCHSEGNISEAIKYYQNFINQGFKDHRVFTNYGLILKNLGKLQEAEISCRKAIELNPDYPKAHSNLGNILRDLGKLKEAELSQRKAIELNPNLAVAHSNLGSILNDLGKLKEAELSQRKAIELNPDLAVAHYNLGNILRDLGKLKEAELSQRKVIELNPNLAVAHSNLGIILRDLGKLKEAEASTRKAIEIKSDYSEAYSNLGNILRDLGNLQEAELSYCKAIEIKPDFAEAHSNLGIILKELGNLQEAEVSTRKAIELNPEFTEASFNLSFFQLLQGDYKNGLEAYEFRFDKVTLDLKPKIKKVDNRKLIKGEKLLVVSEQAPGDVIFYMRYLLPLKQQGIDISFYAPEKLHSLIKDSGIHDNPLTREESLLRKEGEWIPLLSLLKYFSVSPNNPVINTPYISSTKPLKEKWRKILSNEKRPIVGINWQGSKKLEKTYQGRSIPLEEFSKLLEKNDITFLSLQKGYGSEQLEQCSFKKHFVSCQKQIDGILDYSETAAIIENCDLIITNDCSPGPLAAGMGKKVWLLLRDVPFWYWGLTGERTFWYPSMRLFRQKERHNWQEVMERVSIALSSFKDVEQDLI